MIYYSKRQWTDIRGARYHGNIDPIGLIFGRVSFRSSLKDNNPYFPHLMQNEISIMRIPFLSSALSEDIITNNTPISPTRQELYQQFLPDRFLITTPTTFIDNFLHHLLRISLRLLQHFIVLHINPTIRRLGPSFSPNTSPMSLDLSNFAKSPAENEFRSDTFTTPTQSMVAALANASVGDAVYNEDDSTTKLENKVAKLAGKEAGLYCVSGTLLNQIALRTHLFQPPHAILCDHRAHIVVHEAGGLPTLSQALVQTVEPKNGIHLTLKDDILPRFVPDDGEIHGCPTKVISLENTLHGMLFPLDEIKRISAFCKDNGVRLHLDGARLWDASAATGISIAEYCSYFDSVSLCLSKSLGAPIGTVLVGLSQFIRKANHFRKQNGGGIRQSGLLAEMAMVAIDENFGKLTKVHEKAKQVGKFCEELGLVLEHPVHTNFVFIDLAASKIDNDFFVKAAEKHNVRAYGSRIAFHYQVSDEAVENIKKVLKETAEEAKRNPCNTTEVQKLYNVYDSK